MMRRSYLNIVLVTLLATFGFADHHSGSMDVCERSQDSGDSIQAGHHFIFGTSKRVSGVTTLIRDYSKCVVRINMTSSALEAHWAYSIWIVVFNQPERCLIPHACGVGDLEAFGGDPKVKASVFWGGAIMADGTGSADATLAVLPGRTSRELFGNTKNYGLLNFGGAEIHVLLRSHGLAGVSGSVSSQVGTASGGCPPPPPDGPGCVNEFASLHRPR